MSTITNYNEYIFNISHFPYRIYIVTVQKNSIIKDVAKVIKP